MAFVCFTISCYHEYCTPINLCPIQLQPSMLIVPDIQDVYTPLGSDVVVQLAEVGYHFSLHLYVLIAVLLRSNSYFP